ncbi:MAG: NAD/NADP octopine/nopaline dehydrogenase family protein [Clostridiales bacterium]|nr:NAD/NADP octopine/nopaline dehydrogenase family protein [Clostridiales bacterium]MCF8023685.1 NAD/NADP octopine/nopaline dehydrogenase family protein [Clostridiales bacterium]
MVVDSNKSNLKWVVIGGGNGGQAAAGHLALMGYPVKLYDIVEETVAAINKQGGIYVGGEVEGFGELQATTSISEAVKGANIVMVIAPALAHRDIARNCAQYLEDGQVVFIHPGAAGGALEVRKVLDDENCQADVTIAEAESLIYAVRSPRPGYSVIHGIKKTLMVSALPAVENDRVTGMLKEAFPQVYAGTNVLQTSMQNPNNMMHPAPSLLNVSMIESNVDWKYYFDGITPSIGAYVEEMDKEKIALGDALGLELSSILDVYRDLYGIQEETLSKTVTKVMAYKDISGQKTLETRYVLEDIPMGLVPLVSLAKLVGVNVSRMEIIIELGEYLLNKDFVSNGRNVEKLGLAGMTVDEIKHYLHTGEK